MFTLSQVLYIVHHQLKGFVYSLTPASERRDPAAGELAWFRRPVPLALLSGGLVILLNLVFH